MKSKNDYTLIKNPLSSEILKNLDTYKELFKSFEKDINSNLKESLNDSENLNELFKNKSSNKNTILQDLIDQENKINKSEKELDIFEKLQKFLLYKSKNFPTSTGVEVELIDKLKILKNEFDKNSKDLNNDNDNDNDIDFFEEENKNKSLDYLALKEQQKEFEKKQKEYVESVSSDVKEISPTTYIKLDNHPSLEDLLEAKKHYNYEYETRKKCDDNLNTEKLLELVKLFVDSDKDSCKITLNELDNGFYLKVMKENSNLNKSKYSEVFKFPQDLSQSYSSVENLISDAEKHFEKILDNKFKKYSNIKSWNFSKNSSFFVPECKRLKQLATLYFKDEDLYENCKIQFHGGSVLEQNLSFTLFLNDDVVAHYPTKNFNNGKVICNPISNAKNFDELVKEAELVLENLLKEKLETLEKFKIKATEILGSTKRIQPDNLSHYQKIIDNVKVNKVNIVDKLLLNSIEKLNKLVNKDSPHSKFYYLIEEDDCEDNILRRRLNVKTYLLDQLGNPANKNEEKSLFIGKYHEGEMSEEILLSNFVDEMKTEINKLEAEEKYFEANKKWKGSFKRTEPIIEYQNKK